MAPDNRYYDPDARYLHGSKQKLRGNKLTRGGRDGRDAGALFFCKDTSAGRWYVRKYGPISSWRINLQVDQVFDFTDPTHQKKLRERLQQRSAQEWGRIQNCVAHNGHLRWTVLDMPQFLAPPGIDEELFNELGFRGIVFSERIPGEMGAPGDILSIGIFNADDVGTTVELP
jgi:hypothetical protein